MGGSRFTGLPGNAEEYGFDRIRKLEGNALEGKRVCVLGSSVAKGAMSCDHSIAEYLAARLGCRTVKSAVNSTTLADVMPESYIQRLHGLDRSMELDLFLCQLSTNDAKRGIPLGEIGSGGLTIITGAIEHIITYVRETWGCPVVFFTGSRYESAPYAAMVRRLREIRDLYRIGMIDLWADDAFNTLPEEKRALYMYDGIHPTMAGYRDWWGPELERQLLEYITEQV